MITCKRATELISKEREEPLSVSEKALLWAHLFICEFCEQFRKHLEILGKALKREPKGEAALPEEEKAKIRRALAEKSENG